MARTDALKTYKAKRNFSITSEPAEGGQESLDQLSFVIQKHWASRLHYDFRIELDGTMKSWAVPKGPSFDPKEKRMAVHVEDHPISYNSFEGTIPEKQYGAGKVIIWDKGWWEPLGDPHEGYKKGEIKFNLHGEKLRGRWVLIRMKGKGEKQEPWLLIKERDEYARAAAEYSVVDELPDSVAHVKPKAAKKPTARKKVAAKKVAGKKAALPEKLSPELATLVDGIPAGDDWLYEIKFDGYRMLARIEDDEIRILTRAGNDWTEKLPGLVEALAKLKVKSAWLDGEIAVLNPDGVPDFQALQNAFDSKRTKDIVYYLFDMPFCDGVDLREVALEDRRARLRQVLGKKPPGVLLFSENFDAPPADMMASACRIGLEGLIGKRRGSPYVSRRSPDWVKIKCGLRQEFVIGGYTDPQGSRTGLGSLLLGVHDEKGELHHVGNVGTGFNDKTLAEITEKLGALESDDCPFMEGKKIDRKAHWVEPKLLAEVAFGSWTSSGNIRHAVFQGLREDKKAKHIVRENPAHMDKATEKTELPSTLPATLKVSHPERVIDESTGVTKIELVRFYGLVGALMMPHLKGRPVSLVRAPDGIGGQLFFQKHLERTQLAGVKLLPQELDPDHPPLMEVAKPEGLLSAAQMNVVEVHTWNGVKSNIGKPDRMTFDLDPGEGVEFAAMREAANVMRVFLQQLGLKSFVKTSGGKGLHVVVPLKKQYDWDTVKDFSHAIVDHLAATLPKKFSSKSGAKNRVGKIFIDYLRNGFGATTVCAWSVRARPGLGVSVPIAWEEVEKITSGAQWTLQNIHTRLDTGNEPWADYDQSAQSITAAMKTLGFR